MCDPGPASAGADPDLPADPEPQGDDGAVPASDASGLTIELLRRERPITRAEAAQIRTALLDLKRIATGLRSCRVTITGFGRGPDGLARAYAFRLGLGLPDSELEIGRNARPTFEEALRDAFGAAELLLAEYERRWRAIAPSPAELGGERRMEWGRPGPSGSPSGG